MTTLRELKSQILLGEDSRRQFKRDVTIIGIKRAIEDWPNIDFTNDQDGCLFTATIHRKAEETSQKTSQKIIELMQEDPDITITKLAESTGVSDRAIKMQIERLKNQHKINRIGPDKGGHWEVVR